MSDYLKKENILYLRDENGKLLPQDVILELLPKKPMMSAVPMTKGELQRLYAESKNKDSTQEQDSEIIEVHVLEPKMTKEEVKVMKPQYISAMVTGVLSISTGVSQEEIEKESKKKILEQNDFLQ